MASLPSFHARWPTLRGLRLVSGTVLMVYTTLHLLNHAVGLWSLEAADRVRDTLHGLWHSVPGTVLLYGALLSHVAAAGAAVWQRHRWRGTLPDLTRLLSGLALPWLLALHWAATRGADAAFGIPTPYARAFAALWHPSGAALQIALLTVAWLHGCLGLHMAFRARAGWQRALPVLSAVALQPPVLALLGFIAMGRALAEHPATYPVVVTAAQAAAIEHVAGTLRWGWLALLATLLVARQLWQRRLRWSGTPLVTLHYPGRSVQVPYGWSVLEASQAHGIAHLSVCGGRARCSTCRVRISGPAAHHGRLLRDERRTLRRVKATPDMRLACQLRPTGELWVEPLFQAGRPAGATLPHGREQAVAVLFVDLRHWSGLAERQWPFDLVFVLERYFAVVGEAVRDAGGLPNQYIGDSVMALFGLDTSLAEGCRDAVRAARLIEERLMKWEGPLQQNFGHPLAFGMGLHAGPVVLAEVGWRDTTSFTAVGEVVNTASRLQDHSKAAQARLVVSADTARHAGLSWSAHPPQSVDVRGRSLPIDVYCLPGPVPEPERSPPAH